MRIKKSGLTAVAILTVSLMQFHFNAVSPALTSIQAAFPGRPRTEIELVVTAASISVIPAMLLAGLLATRIRVKGIILCGFLLFTISGILSVFTTDFTVLLVLRILTGFGVGITAPFQTSIIPIHFDGYKVERLFGLQCFFASAFGMLYGVMGGWLANIRWSYCFWIYGLGVAGIVIIQLFLPEAEKSTAASDSGSFRVTFPLALIMLLVLCYTVIAFSINTNISYTLEDWKIGNSGTAGVCVALTGMGGLITGLCYGRIAKRLNVLMAASGLAVCGAGFLLISMKTLPLILLGSLLAGMSNGMVMPFCLKLAATLYDARRSAISTALLLCTVSLAQFISPFVTEMMRPSFAVSGYQFCYAVFAASLFVFSGVIGLLSKKTFSV